MYVAFGVVLSDYLLAVFSCIIVRFGMDSFLDQPNIQTALSIVGGSILIVFGLFYFKHQPQLNHEGETIEHVPSKWKMILKGFIFNFFNPTIWLIWLANVTAISKTLEFSLIKMIIYFSIILGAVLLIEIIKAKLASKIKKYVTQKLILIFNNLTGLALICFGSYLIIQYIF